MSQLSLYLDVTTNTLFSGLTGGFAIPSTSLPFFYGDTLPLRIYLIQPIDNAITGSAQYEIIPTINNTLQLYLDGGSEGSTIYTQQLAWSSDPASEYFYANLALNTAGLKALLSNKLKIQCYLRLLIISNGLPRTVYLNPINIQPGGIPPVNLVVPVGQTPISLEVAKTLFVPIQGLPGEGFFMTSPDGTKKVFIQLDNNGQFNASPVQ